MRFQTCWASVIGPLAAAGPFDIFDDLLVRAFDCFFHRSLFSGFDEPETLTYLIALLGPIGADVKQCAFRV
jgi:hypothetical protein